MDSHWRQFAEEPSPAAPQITSDTRLAMAVRLEWTFLVLRYLGYIGLLLAYAIGHISPYTPDLLWVTVGAFLHNGWVHWVLLTKRYELFVTPLNFCFHLMKISLLVGLTGAEDSPIAVLYPVLIIGYCLCSVQFRSTYLVTLGCVSAYAGTIVISWWWEGMDFSYPVAMRFGGIILCGYLMTLLGEMLRKSELEVQSRTQALASSEVTLRAILNTTASPIVVCSENELIVDANDSACEYIGLPRQEMLGRRVRSFLFDDGTLPNKLANLRKRGAYKGESIMLTEDGSERTVNLLVRSFIRDGERYFVAMMHDITEQKEIQEKTRLANLRLERVNRELQRVYQLRATFFGTVAQRLRSPLAAILGHADLLVNEELGVLNEDQRLAAQSCRRSVLRILGLVDEALELGNSPTEIPKSLLKELEADRSTMSEVHGGGD
jgi:PAS domain S-box-containing protein